MDYKMVREPMIADSEDKITIPADAIGVTIRLINSVTKLYEVVWLEPVKDDDGMPLD